MSCPEVKTVEPVETVETVEPVETVEVLYNPPYGGFIFPNKFLKEWEFRYGFHLDTDSSEGDGYETDGWCSISTRVNPRVVSLYKELYPDGGPFAIAVVPKEFAPFIQIHEYDGSESVGINEGRAFKSIIDNYLAAPGATKDQLREQIARFNKLKRLRF